MKEKILESLKAKFEGVSDEILNRIADKLAKTVTSEEQVKTAVDGVTFQKVLESYGDRRATEAQQTAVTNYEKKYGLKDGKKAEEEKVVTPPAGGTDVPEWAKALLDTNKALSERLNKMETERTTETRKQQLNSVIDKLPEALRKGYQRTNIDGLSDEEFTQLVTEVTTEVDGINSEMKAKGAVFGRPTQSGSGQNEGQLSEEQLKEITSRADTPQAGQPF